ncbi:MAG: phage terminase large subunit family protein [Methylibium sp.]|nr:phage terminase large subunit family protein [Methylibium sp.]
MIDAADTCDLSDLDAARRARLMPPPEPRTFAGFAPTMLLPDGEAAGLHWDPSTEPIQQCWVEQCDVPRWQVMVSVQPSQRGKTLKGTALPILHSITEARQSVAYVMPNKEKLDQQWQEKIKPMIEGCGFGAWLPAKGPGARGGKPSSLTMRDPRTGMRAASLFFLAAGGGGKETSLASVTAPVVVVDEADDLESEAHLGLAFRRTRSFGEAYRVYIVSTVNDRRNRDAHPVLIFYGRGTQSRLHYPCPHCGRFQALEWEQVVAEQPVDLDAEEAQSVDAREQDRLRFYREAGVVESGARESAASDAAAERARILSIKRADSCGYRCLACAAIWTEADRHRALDGWRLVHAGQSVADDGTVVGPAPEGRWFSLLGTDLEYHRASLRQIVAEHRGALQALERNDRAPMRQFFGKVLCREWQDDAAERPDLVDGRLTEIAAASTYRRGEIPEGCDLVTVGVDVQLRKHFWIAVAFDPTGLWYILDWGRDAICGDMEQPTPEQRHAGLERIDALMRTGWQSPGGVLLPQAACDTGFRPEEIRPWIAQHRQRWIAAKGVGEQMAASMVRAPLGERHTYEEGSFELRVQDKSPDRVQLFVAADALLDRVAGDWSPSRSPDGINQAPRGHLPQDIDRDLITHLTGMRPGRPGTKKRWEPRGKWHDLLDALLYAIALARYRRVTKSVPRRRRIVGTFSASSTASSP